MREQPLPPPVEKVVREPFLVAARDFLITCFSKPYYLWIYGASLLYGWSALAGSLFAVLFMRETLNMDLDTLGKVRAWVTVLVIPASYFFGSMIDRWKSQKVIVYAVLISAAGNLACFLFIPNTPSFVIWTFLTNIAAYFFGVSYSAYVANALPTAKYAQLTTAMGLVTSFLGVMLMSPICGKFFDLMNNNYRYVYLWQTVFLLLAALAFWRLKAMWIRYGGPDNFQAP